MGTGRPILYDFTCDASPSKVTDCAYTVLTDFSSAGCFHYEDVSVRCYGTGLTLIVFGAVSYTVVLFDSSSQLHYG